MGKQADEKQKRKNDLILFGSILVVAGVLWLLFSMLKQDGNRVYIYLDGAIYGIYPIEDNQRIEIETAHGKNVIQIDNGTVFMKEANCPDQICVEHMPIHSTKEAIVCLPHKLVIEVHAEDGKKTDEIDGVVE